MSSLAERVRDFIANNPDLDDTQKNTLLSIADSSPPREKDHYLEMSRKKWRAHGTLFTQFLPLYIAFIHRIKYVYDRKAVTTWLVLPFVTVLAIVCYLVFSTSGGNTAEEDVAFETSKKAIQVNMLISLGLHLLLVLIFMRWSRLKTELGSNDVLWLKATRILEFWTTESPTSYDSHMRLLVYLWLCQATSVTFTVVN